MRFPLLLLLAVLCASCVILPPVTPVPGFVTPTPEVWTETPTPEPQRGVIVDVSTYLNVRAAPDILAEIVGRLYGGDVVYIVGNSDNGYWLELNDGGWVSAAYVNLELKMTEAEMCSDWRHHETTLQGLWSCG